MRDLDLAPPEEMALGVVEGSTLCGNAIEGHTEEEKARDGVRLRAFSRLIPAASYSPTQFPVQYHGL
jgi:hypothetical protein